MSHRFDASNKHLFEEYLDHLLPLGGHLANAPTEIINSDISTVTGAADKVVRVRENPPWIFHAEPQTYREPGLPRRANMYNAILEHRHEMPVRTVILLLRPEADHDELTGIYEASFQGEPPYRIFKYGVVRVWLLPVATFLTGGLGLLPFAPLSDVREEQLPNVIRRMEERIQQEAPAEEVGPIWTATGVLMGLRYSRDRIARLLEGVHGMKESTFYQGILEEGRITEGQAVLMRQGKKKFGPPSTETLQAIQHITDLARLAELSERLLEVSTWDELLATP